MSVLVGTQSRLRSLQTSVDSATGTVPDNPRRQHPDADIMNSFAPDSGPAIARRYVTAIHPNDERKEVLLYIGQPYEVTPQEWAIPVSMNGLHEREWHLRGIDSWQVVQLAFQFIVQMLEYFVQDGGRVCWPQTDDQFEPAALLPQRHVPVAPDA